MVGLGGTSVPPSLFLCYTRPGQQPGSVTTPPRPGIARIPALRSAAHTVARAEPGRFEAHTSAHRPGRARGRSEDLQVAPDPAGWRCPGRPGLRPGQVRAGSSRRAHRPGQRRAGTTGVASGRAHRLVTRSYRRAHHQQNHLGACL
jgi:hypothetical protein